MKIILILTKELQYQKVNFTLNKIYHNSNVFNEVAKIYYNNNVKIYKNIKSYI